MYHRGEVEIAFPVDNVGANLPTLMTTIAGNLFELGEITGLRLLDLDLPRSYAEAVPGPAVRHRRHAREGRRRTAGR